MTDSDCEVIRVRCAEINIGERHRKEMGDLESLAASISEVGLLQPIGVTEDRRLVFGERRLRAVVEVLGLPDISARVVNVPSILHGEYHENEVRKDFTVSERVAIAAALKEEVAARAKERMHAGKPNGDDPSQNFDQGKTAAIVAEKAGFGNPETFRQAEKVVLKGHADLVKAMDDGEVSISAAAKIASLPKTGQVEVLSGRGSTKPPRRRSTMKKGARGLTLPDEASVDRASLRSQLDVIGRQITAVRKQLESTSGHSGTYKFDLPEQVKRLNLARKVISNVRAAIKVE